MKTQILVLPVACRSAGQVILRLLPAVLLALALQGCATTKPARPRASHAFPPTQVAWTPGHPADTLPHCQPAAEMVALRQHQNRL